MRIMVTGGAGFIGSHFVRHVLATGDDEVVVYDALTYAARRETLDDVKDDPRFSFVHGDVCDRDRLSAAMSGCDAVVHLAGESHVDRSITQPDAFVRTNCGGTNVVCDVATAVGVSRVLYVSTDEVYGSCVEGAFSEEAPLRPSSPYSASKAGGDLIALAHHSTHGLPVLIARSSNNYGPFQFPEKIVALFTTNLLDGGTVPLYGDGRHVRDWIWVQDCCAALDLVLREGQAGSIYNVGGGDEVANVELTRMLLELTGRDASAVRTVPDRLGHDRRYALDTTRIRALGWAPQVGLAEGLAATVEWYRDNRWWWGPLRTDR